MPTSKQATLSRPVLMIDSGSPSDIGLVRSLGMARIPVHVLAAKAQSATATSRFVTKVHAFPEFTAPDEEKVGRLRAIAAGLPERPVVLTSGDRSLRFLSRYRAAFDDLIDHDLPPADLVDLCLRKDLFAARALELGFPTPRTWAPVCASLAYKMADDLEYPVFVKPVHMHRTGSLPVESGHQWSKGWRVASAPALRQLYDVLAAHHADATIIQDYVAGPDSEHASVHVYIDAAGNIVGAFSAQKMRVWPSGAGVGCFVTSRRNDTLIALAARILTTLRYTGFAIVQFKRDVRQNTWKLLEINCRYGTWTELPSRCGCNFPATAYAAITGQPVCRTHQRDGMSWMDFDRDVQAFAADRRRGKGTWWSYLRSISSTGCWAFLALDDPLPFVWRLAHRNAA